MAEGYQNKYVNPPDLSNITKVASLTAGTALSITSVGGWYCVKGINYGTDGNIYAYILDSNDNYLSVSNAPKGAYVRTLTSWMYFPSGTVFKARADFTDSNLSGVFYAPELN